jgi:hypothetical protein
MRSMGEGHRRVLLTFWRGDTLNVPLHRLRRSPSPKGEELPNYCDNCDNPEMGFACNVGFVLRFCASRPQLLRDRLFECVEPQPGFRAR